MRRRIQKLSTKIQMLSKQRRADTHREKVAFSSARKKIANGGHLSENELMRSAPLKVRSGGELIFNLSTSRAGLHNLSACVR